MHKSTCQRGHTCCSLRLLARVPFRAASAPSATHAGTADSNPMTGVLPHSSTSSSSSSSNGNSSKNVDSNGTGSGGREGPDEHDAHIDIDDPELFELLTVRTASQPEASALATATAATATRARDGSATAPAIESCVVGTNSCDEQRVCVSAPHRAHNCPHTSCPTTWVAI
ncbi:hypothetical protein PTSG_01297 [Salpingoeca rosetta]|uniref:Uncharacterized protein n=1 Tax=Salpingoeca rosetta (strain ATCC 50818 / BSB-021) TaxID=946362 RepID=F2TZX9_SALR5|nr:uncharacterized protein PTSG_01297 [Salpingoeca rosetta]EGD80707.1 hypothetical protein PTSG_01297 [Salpingoeca rosetta]|eukprot:XP_004997268.1 hypothetical protein PTSG_01297 [Salpingoeca rosetta]